MTLSSVCPSPARHPARFALALTWAFFALTLPASEENIEPVTVLEKAETVYPKTMIVYNTLGQVVIRLNVDEAGRPSLPRVLQCNHYEFETPGVESALKWKFAPARRAGIPISSTATITLSFRMVGHNSYAHVNNWAPFVIPPVSPADYPADFQYDEAPHLLLHCRPVYPRDLLIQNVKSPVTVSFLVDPSGRPRRIEVTDAKRPEFAAAARAMVGEWRFRPAQKLGKPTWTSLAYKVWFDKAGRDMPFSPATAKLVAELKKPAPAILDDVGKLDQMPVTRYRVEPTVPDALRQARTPASAEIEFILDTEGHVQLPKIISSTDEAFGWAAATALCRWIYPPPTQGGKPVNAFMRVTLNHDPSS